MDQKRILIVDDDPSLVESLRAALSPRYEVRAASNGEAALTFLKEEHARLIILDLVLGAEDGLELLPALRQVTPARILLLTGYGTRENLLRAIRAKPDDFLDKPVDVQGLRRSVAALLDDTGHEEDPLEHLRGWIAQESHRPLTVDALARAAGMSVRHLRGVFHRRFGITLRGYLEQCRMKRAAILLRTTDCQIKELASQVGYADVNYFSTTFKRFYGISPEAFRTQHMPSSRETSPPGPSLMAEIQR